MKSKMQNMSLRIKIPLLFCLLLMLVVMAFGTVLYSYFQGYFQQNYQQSFEMAMTANANAVQELFVEVKAATSVVNDNMVSYVGNKTENISVIADLIINTDPESDSFDLYSMIRKRELCESTMRMLFQSAENCALLLDEEYPISMYLPDWRTNRGGFCKSTAQKDKEWYKKTVEADGEPYIFVMEEKKDKLFIATLLKYQYFKFEEAYEIRNLGVLVVEIPYALLMDRIDISKMPQNTQIAFVKNSANVLYCNQKTEQLLPNQELIKALDNTEYGLSSYYTYDGVRYLVQKSILINELEIVTVMPTNIIHEMSAKMLTTLLMIAVVTLGFGMVFTMVLSRAIVLPIVNLSKQMEKGLVEQMNLQGCRKDEIGVLYYGYNMMQQRIREMLQKVWEIAEKQKKTELHLLQAQINPHFIYNTLGTISCQALLRGEDQIAEHLNLLTQIMRYSTKNPHDLVPLGQEIQMIGYYAQIQEINNKNIQFTFSVAEDCKDVLIPKLIIQPLVENAVLHGVSSRKEEGHISVCVEMEAPHVMTIVVADNGCNADADAINSYIRGETGMHCNHDSMGVKNVNDRIHNVFGNEGNLIYRKSVAGTLEAVITIKLS